LGILFYRFISENLTSYINADEHRSVNKDFDYAALSDKEAKFGRADTVKEKVFYILPSELFVNACINARNNANLNETDPGRSGPFKRSRGNLPPKRCEAIKSIK
jgi:type I restriction enzyme M protein